MKFSFTSILAAVGHGIMSAAAYVENDMITKQPVSGDVAQTAADVKKTVSDGLTSALSTASTQGAQAASTEITTLLTPVVGAPLASFVGPTVAQGLMTEGASLIEKL